DGHDARRCARNARRHGDGMRAHVDAAGRYRVHDCRVEDELLARDHDGNRSHRRGWLGRASRFAYRTDRSTRHRRARRAPRARDVDVHDPARRGMSTTAYDIETMQIGETTLLVRPIAIPDVDRLSRMFDRLSPTTVYRRFFSPIQKPPRSALLWLAN